MALTTFTNQAYALSIDVTVTPATQIFASGDENNQNDINDALALLNVGAGIGFELYKNDVDTGESGALLGSYDTTFYNSSSDPEDADITYTAGGFISDNPFLLVKDEKLYPALILFYHQTVPSKPI